MSRQWREALIALALLLLPIIVFYSNSKPVRDHNLLDRSVMTIATPIVVVFDWLFDTTGHIWQDYIALVDVQQENRRLKHKVFRLETEMYALREAAFQAQRMRQLVDMVAAPRFNYIGAHVIGLSPSPLFQSIKIDKGSGQGLFVGAGVIGPGGVVGRITAISEGYADVMLLSDANATVDVLIQRTRTRGRVRGMGDEASFRAKVNYLLRTDDIRLNDVVVTSGLDGIFPKGIVVGRVIEMKRKHYGLYQEVLLQAGADFSHLEEVLVLLPPSEEGVDDSYSDLDAGSDGEHSPRRL